ncbi:hypothetical protein [Aquimarina algiphila]|uniref:hypothetical protein n=1 Tax=Aquimarina algiphila TaxID=2047982 RepID=UPI00232F3836|nr:hypothetical protein [Aquimarina algiphila]
MKYLVLVLLAITMLSCESNELNDSMDQNEAFQKELKAYNDFFLKGLLTFDNHNQQKAFQNECSHPWMSWRVSSGYSEIYHKQHEIFVKH